MDCVGGYTEHSLVCSFIEARKRFESTELHLHGVTGM